MKNAPVYVVKIFAEIGFKNPYIPVNFRHPAKLRLHRYCGGMGSFSGPASKTLRQEYLFENRFDDIAQGMLRNPINKGKRNNFTFLWFENLKDIRFAGMVFT